MHRETTCLLLSQEKLTFQMGKGLCRHEARPTHWTPTVTVLNPQQDDPLEKCLSFFLLLHSSQPGTDEANTHTTSGSVFLSSCAPHSRSVPSLTAHAVHFVGSGNPFQQPGLSHCPDRQHNPVSLISCLLSCQVCTFPRTFIHFKDEEVRRTNEVNPDRGVSGCSTHFVVIKDAETTGPLSRAPAGSPWRRNKLCSKILGFHVLYIKYTITDCSTNCLQPHLWFWDSTQLLMHNKNPWPEVALFWEYFQVLSVRAAMAYVSRNFHSAIFHTF